MIKNGTHRLDKRRYLDQGKLHCTQPGKRKHVDGRKVCWTETDRYAGCKRVKLHR